MATTSSAELSLLGVPEQAQKRAPSISSFPPNFNPQLRSVWDGIFKDADSRTLLNSQKTIDGKWNWVIREYLGICLKQEITPFNDKYANVDNNRINVMLGKQRERIVKFLDQHKLLKDVTVKTVRRRVTRTVANFTIHIEAVLNVKDHMLDDFISTLISRSSGFVGNSDGAFEKHLNPHVVVSFTPKSNNQYLFCYRVTHIEHPYIAPGSSRGVSKKKYEDYIIKNIWLPIIKKKRFAHYKGNVLL